MTKKSILYYSILAIFVGSALVTLLGLSQVIFVKDQHLSWLLITLIGQIVAAVITLFRGATFFDEPNVAGTTTDQLVLNTDEVLVTTPKIGTPPLRATNREEKNFLAEHKQWEIVKSKILGKEVRELHRIYEFKTFEAAFEFMKEASEKIISKQDHHPKWTNTFNRVEIWVSTFHLGRQLSCKDLKQAESFEALWVSMGKGLKASVKNVCEKSSIT